MRTYGSSQPKHRVYGKTHGFDENCSSKANDLSGLFDDTPQKPTKQGICATPDDEGWGSGSSDSSLNLSDGEFYLNINKSGVASL
jgi:hypothetical protein